MKEDSFTSNIIVCIKMLVSPPIPPSCISKFLSTHSPNITLHCIPFNYCMHNAILVLKHTRDFFFMISDYWLNSLCLSVYILLNMFMYMHNVVQEITTKLFPMILCVCMCLVKSSTKNTNKHTLLMAIKLI